MQVRTLITHHFDSQHGSQRAGENLDVHNQHLIHCDRDKFHVTHPRSEPNEEKTQQKNLMIYEPMMSLSTD